MGYILPVTHHTYKNYHNRMRKQKKSPHQIGKTYKVVFHKIERSYDFHQGEALYKRSNKGKKVSDKKQPLQFQIGEHEQVKLTGKGKRFNKTV